METFLTIISGVLFTVGTYLILNKNLLRIILGISMFSHATHLLLMAVNGVKRGAAPLLGEKAASFTDPLPQALILTSIVISFALTAFLLVLGYRTYVELKRDFLRKWKDQPDE